jgi:hypothetical protein
MPFVHPFSLHFAGAVTLSYAPCASEFASLSVNVHLTHDSISRMADGINRLPKLKPNIGQK